MLIRNVDKNWDWCFGSSKTNYVRNEHAVILDIQMRLKEWYGDCFFALQNGIPWRERLGNFNQKELLDRDILNTIQNTQGVLNVFDFTSSTDGRRYQAQCNVYTQYSANTIPLTIDSEDYINA